MIRAASENDSEWRGYLSRITIVALLVMTPASGPVLTDMVTV